MILRGPVSFMRDFLNTEAAGGVILMIAAGFALLVANGPMAPDYLHLLHAPLGPMSVHQWINDALMAVFFLLVGLEIKREFAGGQLATWEQRRLPVIAAAAGMIAPALVYLAIAGGTPGLANGWAIPAATDIAFAIGVLALLGSRAPASLKLLLTTIAIVDDLGAVAIIAIAYTAGLNGLALLAAAVVLVVMAAMNRFGVKALAPYLIGFVLLWCAVLLSGVHATVAGVLAAFTVPLGRPLERLEHALHPWVAFLIVPLFGFANAGVSLEGLGLGALLAPLPLGIAAGLFLGKQIGIFAAIRLSARFRLARQPAGATWLQIYGMALLCGIGFTMSLFIGALAFPGDPALVEEAKIGVLAGSLVSAVMGYVVLRFASSGNRTLTP